MCALDAPVGFVQPVPRRKNPEISSRLGRGRNARAAIQGCRKADAVHVSRRTVPWLWEMLSYQGFWGTVRTI